MRAFQFFILILFLAPSFVFSQWINQNSSVTSNLKSIYFIDENTGWACGNNVILKTTDSGNSWSSYNIAGEFKSIFYINSMTGFTAGSNGKFFKTMNGGTTWDDLSYSGNINFTSINFASGIGLITGSGNTVLKSTDNGSKWDQISTETKYDFYSSYILDKNNFIVVGSPGSVIRTTNGGSNWSDLTFGMVNPFFSVQFINYQTGWVIGCCGMYFKTTDSGLSWTEEFYLTKGFTIHSSKFVNENTGWITADAGLIYRTTDSGESWYSLTTNTGDDLFSIFMLDENTGWAAGNFGTILKTTNGGGPGTPISIQNISQNIPDEFILYQNYPNPFNPVTNIKFSIPATQHTTLKVFDINGSEVATLVNEVLNAGEYSYDFRAESYGLSSGVYFYKFTTDDYSQTRKLVLLK